MASTTSAQINHEGKYWVLRIVNEIREAKGTNNPPVAGAGDEKLTLAASSCSARIVTGEKANCGGGSDGGGVCELKFYLDLNSQFLTI